MKTITKLTIFLSLVLILTFIVPQTTSLNSLAPKSRFYTPLFMQLQTGIITTIAGNGNNGFSGDNTPAIIASLDNPQGVTIDNNGNLFIADSGNNRIRKVDKAGVITTIAGNGNKGFNGNNILAVNASLDNPEEIVIDSNGNLFIADSGNNQIRKVDKAGIITTIAGNSNKGFSGDGSLATNASLSFPIGIALDSNGNLFIADAGNGRIRRVAKSTGIITTIAGNGNKGFSGDGNLATNASFNNLRKVAVDSNGTIFVADFSNNRVRKIDKTTGVITTVAGNGSIQFSGDGKPATSAPLAGPASIVIDSINNIFISESGNHRIRKVDASTNIITTVAGNGLGGFNGDQNSATDASLNSPLGIALESTGNLFIADTRNNRVRKVTFNGAPNPGDFSLNVSPTTQTVVAGDSTSFTINAQAINGFSQPISLSTSLSSPNPNISLSLSNNTINPNSSVILTVNTNSSASSGTFSISITGTSGQIVRTNTATVTVTLPNGGGGNGNPKSVPFTFSSSNQNLPGIGTGNQLFTTSSTASDFDGTGGLNDFAAIDQKNNTVQIFLNVGSSSAQISSVPIANPFSSGSFKVTEVTTITDPSGLNDLVVVVNSTTSNNSQILLFRNDGTGTFRIKPIITSVPSGINGLIVGDIRNTGRRTDLFFLDNSGQANALLNDGNNQFTPVVSPGLIGTGLKGISAVVADVNDDDNLDVVVLAQNPNLPDEADVVALLGSSDGKFITSTSNITKVPGPALAIVGGLASLDTTPVQRLIEFNGDFLPDFAVVSSRGGTLDKNNAAITLLFGRPAGVIRTKPELGLFSAQAPIDLIDKTTGTKLSLDKSLNGPGQVSVIDGTTGVGGATTVMAVTDFNADGSPDLVVTGTQVINGTNFRSAMYLSGDISLGTMQVIGSQRTAEYAKSGSSLNPSVDGGDTFVACIVGNFAGLPNLLPDVVHISINGSVWVDANTTNAINRVPILNINRTDLNAPFPGGGRKIILTSGEERSISVNGTNIGIGDKISFSLASASGRQTVSDFLRDFVRVVDNGNNTCKVIIDLRKRVISTKSDPLFFLVIVEGTNQKSVVRTSFTLVVMPTVVQDISPNTGTVGTGVNILGNGLAQTQIVRFNGVKASPPGSNEQNVTTTVPMGATTGLVSVEASDSAGSQNIINTSTLLINFTVTSPSITSFAPISGFAGLPVVIKGGSFTGASAVTFNGTPAQFTVDNDNQITATVPQNANSGPITVVKNNLSSTSPQTFNNNFTVLQNRNSPIFNSFSPTFAIAGKTITITGTNLSNVQSVQFNGVAADFTSVSDTTLTAIVPDNATSGLITITTGEGTATSPGIFTFVPTTSSIQANITEVFLTGAATDPNIIFNIVGTNFANNSRVFFINNGIRQQVPIQAFNTDPQGNQIIIVSFPNNNLAMDLLIEVDNTNGMNNKRYRVSVNRTSRTIPDE